MLAIPFDERGPHSIGGGENGVRPRGLRLPGRLGELANRLDEGLQLRLSRRGPQHERDGEAEDDKQSRAHHGHRQGDSNPTASSEKIPACGRQKC